MGATFFKLMFYMAVLVTYVYLNRSEAIPFIIVFGIAYLFYTTFEVIAILRYLKARDKEKV